MKILDKYNKLNKNITVLLLYSIFSTQLVYFSDNDHQLYQSIKGNIG